MIYDVARRYLEVGQRVKVNIPRNYNDIYSNSLKAEINEREGTLVTIIPADHGLAPDNPSYFSDTGGYFSFAKFNKETGWRAVVKFDKPFIEDGLEYTEKEILLTCLNLATKKKERAKRKVYNPKCIKHDLKVAIIATISSDKDLLLYAQLAKSHKLIKDNCKDPQGKWDWESMIDPIIEIAKVRIIKSDKFTRAIVRQVAHQISPSELLDGVDLNSKAPVELVGA
jgi:hypothetical protein